MLKKLSETLKKATDKISNAIFIDKNLIDSIVLELQRALIEADVSVPLVKKLTDKIKKAALNERIKGIDKKEHLIKLLHDELVNILGNKKSQKTLKLKSGKTQNRIMFVGLYGTGKTTTIGKLGNYFSKRGHKTGIIGLDVHRPAAPEQLKQTAEKHNLNVFVDLEEKDALKIWKDNEKNLKDFPVVLIDTAGRHTLDKELVKEIKTLNKEIRPTEIILVMPADIGQAAKRQAQEFKKALDITGVIITRMDSSAKGGGALTACNEVQAPVYFITTGENINDIEPFNPESFLSRLLGMGDLNTLMEKIRSVTEEKDQEKIQEELESGKLSLESVIEQVKSMNSMGGFSKIKGMIPGFANVQGKVSETVLEKQESKISKWEHILKSMTPEEKSNPELLEKQTSRIKRIATGAGVNTSDVRSLLKQHKLLNEMIQTSQDFDMSSGLSQKQMQKLVKKLGKGKKIRF